jgi:hypothetical protein
VDVTWENGYMAEEGEAGMREGRLYREEEDEEEEEEKEENRKKLYYCN